MKPPVLHPEGLWILPDLWTATDRAAHKVLGRRTELAAHRLSRPYDGDHSGNFLDVSTNNPKVTFLDGLTGGPDAPARGRERSAVSPLAARLDFASGRRRGFSRYIVQVCSPCGFSAAPVMEWKNLLPGTRMEVSSIKLKEGI